MNATSNDTVRIHRRASAMRKLTGLLLVALLSSTIPASAARLVVHNPAPVSRHADADINGCALPQLPLQIDAPLVLRPSAGHEYADRSRIAENRWATGATSDWNAAMNRAVDRLVSPPENANVYAVQTEDRLDGRFGETHGPNATLAGFEIVIH